MKELCLPFLVIFSIISGEESTQVVFPGGALIKGTLIHWEGKKYGVYKKIPYAEFEKRFQPGILRDVIGELDATGNSGPKCPQVPSNSLEENEDCLHLDIYTPPKQAGDSLVPVMFWIHGGGFSMGSTQDLDPEGVLSNLVSRGVIVVAINYRLGPLGFFVNPELGISGNLGLLDQTLALQWVQNNIQAFGGDPKRVTIFGQSAGAISCSLLMLSPLARGLFSQAILMSGAASPSLDGQFRQMKDVIDMRTFSTRLIGMVGCKDAVDVLGCLQTTEVSNLRSAATEISTKGEIWWPTMNDGTVLPGSLEELNLNRLPIPAIVGTTKDEMGLSELMPLSPNVFSEEGMRAKIDEFVKKDANGLSADEVKQQLTEEYVDKFLALSPENAKNGSRWLQQSVDMQSTSLFHVGAHKEALALHQKGSPVFLYSFDYFNPSIPIFQMKLGLNWTGSIHATDVVFLFGKKPIDSSRAVPSGLAALLTPSTMTPKDLEIIDLLGTLWTNFAKTGKPLEIETTWSEFDPEESNYLSLNWPGLGMKTGFHQEAIQFWEKLEDGRSAGTQKAKFPILYFVCVAFFSLNI